MSEMTIEHAGVHYASHTLLETRRELDRERQKMAMMESGIKGDVMTLYPAAREMRSTDGAATRDAVPAVTGNAASAHTSTTVTITVSTQTPTTALHNPPRVTDRLDELGQHPMADHTRRLQACTPPPVADQLRSPCKATPDCVPPVSDTAQHKEEEKEQDGPLIDTAPELSPDERLATELICANPRLKREFDRILQLLQSQRSVRERFAAFEELERVAIADLWALEWERLYDANLHSRRDAAESERERVERAHWHERVLQRRAEILAELEERESEALLHSEELLRLIDMKSAFDFWLTQIASFDVGLPALEGPPAPLALEAGPSVAAEEGAGSG